MKHEAGKVLSLPLFKIVSYQKLHFLSSISSDNNYYLFININDQIVHRSFTCTTYNYLGLQNQFTLF